MAAGSRLVRSGQWSGNRRPLWWLAVSHDLLSKSRDRHCGGTNGGATLPNQSQVQKLVGKYATEI